MLKGTTDAISATAYGLRCDHVRANPQSATCQHQHGEQTTTAAVTLTRTLRIAAQWPPQQAPEASGYALLVALSRDSDPKSGQKRT